MIRKDELFGWLKGNYGTAEFFKSLANSVFIFNDLGDQGDRKEIVFVGGITQVLFDSAALSESEESGLYRFFHSDFFVSVTKYEVLISWTLDSRTEQEVCSMYELKSVVW